MVPDDPFRPLEKPLRPATAKSEPHRTNWIPLVPVPADAPPKPESHKTRGAPSHWWCYRDQDGRALVYITRFDRPDGGWAAAA